MSGQWSHLRAGWLIAQTSRTLMLKHESKQEPQYSCYGILMPVRILGLYEYPRNHSQNDIRQLLVTINVFVYIFKSLTCSSPRQAASRKEL